MKVKKKTKLRSEVFTVVGIRHRLTAQGRRQVATMVPFVVALKREKMNPVDKNAIAVHIIDPKMRAMGRLHIGYLRRQVAEELAPRIDSGRIDIESAVVTAVDSEDGEATMKLTWRELPSS